MKNIEKKWILFLLATFVTFLGIGYTLIKGTEAKENLPKTTISDLKNNDVRTKQIDMRGDNNG